MTPGEYTEFVKNAVAAQLECDKFIHHSTDEFVSLSSHSLHMLLIAPIQGQPAYFNREAYLTIIDKFVFSANGIAQHLPHRFGALFPLPFKALVAASVSILLCWNSWSDRLTFQIEGVMCELTTGVHIAAKFNERNRQKYLSYHSSLIRMDQHEYLTIPLQKIQKRILACRK